MVNQEAQARQKVNLVPLPKLLELQRLVDQVLRPTCTRTVPILFLAKVLPTHPPDMRLVHTLLDHLMNRFDRLMNTFDPLLNRVDRLLSRFDRLPNRPHRLLYSKDLLLKPRCLHHMPMLAFRNLLDLKR